LKVLFRHIGAEVVQRALIILAVITALLLLGKGLEFLEEMAQGEIPGQAVLALLGLAVPRILALALPLALFFGLLTTIARLCLDSEMDAMAAAGLGFYNLLPLMALISGAGLILEAGLTMYVVPAGQERLAEATTQFQKQALTSLVRTGRFNEFPGGRVLFFRERDGQGRMKEVFFHDPEPRPEVTITANRGELSQDPDGKVEAVFYDGVRYQGRPREDLVRVMAFDRYRVHKSLGEVKADDGGREALATDELIRRARAGDDVEDAVELFRRMAIPLSIPVLVLLALPLGVENRRSGTRSYGILWGALFVLAYHNGLIVVEEWASNGVVAAHWMLWAVPLPTAVLAGYLLRRTVHGLPLVPRPGWPRWRRKAGAAP
jgi:lipopolysaccharide export system permease protein